MYYHLELTPAIVQQIDDCISFNDMLIDNEKLLLPFLDKDYDPIEYNSTNDKISIYTEFHNFLTDLKVNPTISVEQYIYGTYLCDHCNKDFRAVLEAFTACDEKVTRHPHKMKISVTTVPFESVTTVPFESESSHIPQQALKNPPKQSLLYLAIYNRAKSRNIAMTGSITPTSLNTGTMLKK